MNSTVKQILYFLHLVIMSSLTENAPPAIALQQKIAAATQQQLDDSTNYHRHSISKQHTLHHIHDHDGLELKSNNGQDEMNKLALLEFPDQLTISVGTTVDVQFIYRAELHSKLNLIFGTDPTLLKAEPNQITLGPGQNSSATLALTGLALSSRTFLDLDNCSLLNESEPTRDECPFNKDDVFILVTIVKSSLISILVIISGWIYFFAWSISFYPQIMLNWERKSVVGLNFDFLFLNVIGFACYTVYNVLLYFDENVQDLYVARHGHRSLIPVLINDVVFAAHALLACLITGFQCFIYDRGNQRISHTCRIWASFLLCFSFASLLLAIIHWMNWLDFINYLAYVKMAITLSKYFPQAILNFRRKSTLGWSIGNVLLDFSGGSMDICQMILQASNTDDWSAFTGNPVKFGLGLISMIFDVLFIIQHYFLYPEKAIPSYDQVDDSLQPSTQPVVLDPDSEGNVMDTEPVVSP